MLRSIIRFFNSIFVFFHIRRDVYAKLNNIQAENIWAQPSLRSKTLCTKIVSRMIADGLLNFERCNFYPTYAGGVQVEWTTAGVEYEIVFDRFGRWFYGRGVNINTNAVHQLMENDGLYLSQNAVKYDSIVEWLRHK